MISLKRKALLVLTCAAFGGVLGGCTAVALMKEAGDYIRLGDVNIKEKNYIAADYLAGLTHATVNKRAIIVPEPLMHANNSGMTSPFGYLVTEQIGSRFAQLGYNVQIPDKNNPAAGVDPRKGIALRGTYLPSGGAANISLRLVNRATNQILGAYDYTLPVNGEIAELMEDRPIVFRVQPQQVEHY